LLVPVATIGTNGLYKPGLKAFFPSVKEHAAKMSGESGAQPTTMTRRWAAMDRELAWASDQALGGDDLYCGDLRNGIDLQYCGDDRLYFLVADNTHFSGLVDS
jgi:hypothetical protein